MPGKVTLKHQTADGVVHTRQTARTYSHVIVRTWDTGQGVCNWVGRQDLVASALTAAAKLYPECQHAAEPINNGTRQPQWAPGEDSADRAEAAHAGGFQD